MLVKSQIAEVIKTYGLKEGDTGSPEVQVAILTKRIEDLGQHFSAHVKDHSSKRGLMKLIGRRKSLLKYLSQQSVDRYQNLIQRLGLRK